MQYAVVNAKLLIERLALLGPLLAYPKNLKNRNWSVHWNLPVQCFQLCHQDQRIFHLHHLYSQYSDKIVKISQGGPPNNIIIIKVHLLGDTCPIKINNVAPSNAWADLYSVSSIPRCQHGRSQQANINHALSYKEAKVKSMLIIKGLYIEREPLVSLPSSC